MRKVLALVATSLTVAGSALVWTVAATPAPADIAPIAPAHNEALTTMVAAAADAQSQDLVAYGLSGRKHHERLNAKGDDGDQERRRVAP